MDLLTTAVVLVAAGDGTRLASAGAGLPKALVFLANRSILDWSLDSVLAADVQAVVVVAPPASIATVRAVVEARADDRLTLVAGASTRQGSVAAGLAVVPARARVVLVHDAARPLTPASVFDAVRAAVVSRRGGVVPTMAVTDTIKQLHDDVVSATIDRSRLAAVQTPQGFPADALRRAYAAATEEYTDDAALFAAAGGTVTAVPGDEYAFKITTAGDLFRAEQLLRPRADAHRVGVGVDSHRFDPATPLWLGGVEWPGEPGLAGHSDGDVICHAVADALLAAATLGDLGSVFGVDRPEEAGRRGVDFVERASRMLRDAGFRAVNVSVQVLGNRPKLAARRDEMQQAVGRAARAVVSIAGTTTDGLGAMGRGEGLTAIATALVVLEPFLWPRPPVTATGPPDSDGPTG